MSAPAVIPPAPRGRGAQTNAAGRFESMTHEAFDDGWTDADAQPAKLKTTLSIDRARTIITRNDSPDIGFDRSINPYRGCEHGWMYTPVTHRTSWISEFSPLFGDHPPEKAMAQVQEADRQKDDGHCPAKTAPNSEKHSALCVPKPDGDQPEPSDTHSECQKPKSDNNNCIRHSRTHCQTRRIFKEQAWHFVRAAGA
jgi:hypothetical protein